MAHILVITVKCYSLDHSVILFRESHTKEQVRFTERRKLSLYKHVQKQFKAGRRRCCTSLIWCCRCWGLRWWPGRWHRSEKSCSDSQSRSAGWVKWIDTADQAPLKGTTSTDAWTLFSPTCTPTNKSTTSAPWVCGYISGLNICKKDEFISNIVPPNVEQKYFKGCSIQS